MAKKQKTKREFDWRTYSKPARLLTEPQERAFRDGELAPVLAWATADARTRFEVRARSASIYHRGASLVRILGDGPFVGEFEPTDGSPPERVELGDEMAVAGFLHRLDAIRSQLDDAPEARNRRSYAHAIARGNSGEDPAVDAMVVVDSDYSLGRRKLDLVALLRSEGVSGPGGFANPDLVFIDVRVPGQSLTGPGGLVAIADDLADFGKALSGEHVRRAAFEMTELANQKVRLGLLPPELEVRSVSDSLPHFLVAFAENDPTPPANDTMIIELHERLASRHYPTHRLSFVHFTQVPEDGEGLTLEPGDAMDYREFKAYRYADR